VSCLRVGEPVRVAQRFEIRFCTALESGKRTVSTGLPTVLLLTALTVMFPDCAQAASGSKPTAGPTDVEAATAHLPNGWTATGGRWRFDGFTLSQTSLEPDCRAFSEPVGWSDYVFEVKAKKTGGAEGFLILFRATDRRDFYWWNIAGWANKQHALETRAKRRVFCPKPGEVQTGRWYDVKVVVKGDTIKCYLNGKLIHDAKDASYASGGIGLGSWRTQVEYRDPVVKTLDGTVLYTLDMAQAIESTLGMIGSTGGGFRPEFDALRQSGAPRDDQRWRDLYGKVCNAHVTLRNTRAKLQQIDLGAARRSVQRLIDTCTDAGARARALLEKLDDCQRRMPRIEASLGAGDLSAVEEVERTRALLREVAELRRGLYVGRCPPIAFLKRPAHGRKGTNATMLGQRTKEGSAICIYDPARPDRGVRTIFEAPKGFVFDMSVSYDGRKLLFSFMNDIGRNAKEGKDSFHIWEIGVDGKGLRQLTTGAFHDGSAVYLPDGRIVFCSTRVESFSLCQDYLAAGMYIMDGDGGNLRRIEYNTLCDTTPSVMDDGSILFGRWEYQDKNIFCVQGLWTINPDGKRVQLYYGNTLTIPNAIYGAKQIPETNKVVCVMAAHHRLPLGAIAIIDRALGLENPRAMVNITPEIPYQPRLGEAWNHATNRSWGPGDVLYPWSYTDPWPLAEDLFLVSYGGPLEGGPKRYRLFLLDDRGEKALLYEDPKISCFNPVPVIPRPVPHKIPGRVPEPEGTGTFYVLDVYQGLLDKGVKRGQVKAIRIMSQIPKKYNTEGMRYQDHYPVMGEGSYYGKYCYGTVPVYQDGSAYFEAPAGVELYFQALDASGKEIRRMGSVTQITAGEIQGCIGCHESRTTPPGNMKIPAKRWARGPDTLTPPPWGAGPVDFVKQVQPVFDRYCVECHSGRVPPAGIDLSGDKSRLFNMAFSTLTDKKLVDFYYINHGPTGNFPPLRTGARVSKLTNLIESGHSKVNMDDESRRRIYAWIDANVPYYGTWDMSRPHTLGGRDTWFCVKGNRRVTPEPEPWFGEFHKLHQTHCAGCHGSFANMDMKRWSFREASDRWINLTHPEYSRVLNAHLSKKAGGMEVTTAKKGKTPPVFQDTNDPIYRAMLATIQAGKRVLDARPRMDMAGGVAVPQQRDFGKLY